MLIKKAMASAAAAGLMSLLSTGSVLAGTTVVIKDNGYDSDNIVRIRSGCQTTVIQGSETWAVAQISSSASTGGNEASGNTGGNVTVDTGKATSDVAVSVTGGDNSASVDSCCACLDGELDVKIMDNGAKSFNKVNNATWFSETAIQAAKTKAFVGIAAKAKTGKNKAKHNTGGAVIVTTDNAKSTVDVTVEGGTNTLNP